MKHEIAGCIRTIVNKMLNERFDDPERPLTANELAKVLLDLAEEIELITTNE